MEVDGVDHFPQVGSLDWVEAVEEFTTGTLGRARRRPSWPSGRPLITTMGGFDVVVDGERVPVSAWVPRRARQLCKRIVVAIGAPVTRDELAEMLWPDEAGSDRLGARLSVLLSNVRRVLGGGVVADHAAVRMDLDHVQLDLDDVGRAVSEGDDPRAVSLYWGSSCRKIARGLGRRSSGTASHGDRRRPPEADHGSHHS